MDPLTISNIILSTFVGFHILCEFYHYVSEFFNSKREKKTLKYLVDRADALEKMHVECKKCKGSKNE